MMRTLRGRRAAVVGLILLLVAAARAQERVGTVAALEGSAEVLHAGRTDWAPLAAGAEVLLGDRVRTGDAGRVKLLMRDDSVLTLGAASELVVDAQVAAPARPQSGFRLPVGTLRAVVDDRYGGAGSRFEVETPTAVAGVRGTTFLVRHDAIRDETQVIGMVRTVSVRALADPRGRRAVLVGPGEITVVERGALPTKPRKLTPAERDALAAATVLLGGGRQAEPELATPDTGAGGPRALEGGDPARGLVPGPDGLSPEERAVDQPVEKLRQLERQQRPPPIPPTRQAPRGSSGAR